MINKTVFTAAVIFFCIFLLSVAGAADTRPVRIHGGSGIADIDDVIFKGGEKITQNDIRRICAEITERYHSAGYTAFFINKAVLNKDGTADLFFNESPVTDISVNTELKWKDGILQSIYIRGDIFNEFVLKENVQETKRKYNLKKLNVNVKREEAGGVILEADIVEKFYYLKSEVYRDPVYGIVPGVLYGINYGDFSAGVSLLSSFKQRDRSWSSALLFLKNRSKPLDPYFNFSADISDRDELNNDGVQEYNYKSLELKGGYCFYIGYTEFGFFLQGTGDLLSGYSDMTGGCSFSGFQFKISYDNSARKIGYEDAVTGEAAFSSGWNFVENRPAAKISITNMFNISLYPGLFLSVSENLNFTSDREYYKQFYVYDKLFPCRDNDYSKSPVRNVAGMDIVYEISGGTLFIAPGVKWGFYRTSREKYNTAASGLKILYRTEGAQFEVSYLNDLRNHIKDGFIMFSAGAVYL